MNLSPNEFINYDDYFGLFNQDPEPYNYLVVENDVYSSTYFDGRPRAEFRFVLSDIKRTQERKFYTLMQLIGDVGGFNSAIVLFPTVIMGFYSAHSFEKSISSDIPVKKKKRKKEDQGSNLRRKLQFRS